ncbi:hypothetical protein [Alteribacillus sp. HJP-4]|uniref:hypothetical protein n=1 Tax=Alteribacillus sp. HJP-4 TaxID=2775394 RepID=UPI0035CD03AC
MPKFQLKDFHPKVLSQKLINRLNPQLSTDSGESSLSRMEKRRQEKESKLDNSLFRASLSAFVIICVLLACIPIIYFLPWPQLSEWFVFVLLGALFISFSLSAITIKKQSRYVKLPYMWGIMIFSILLLLFYLFILVYFRFLLS